MTWRDPSARSTDSTTYSKWPTRLFGASLFIKTLDRLKGAMLYGMRGNDGSEYSMCDNNGLIQTNIPQREQFVEFASDHVGAGMNEAISFDYDFLLYWAWMDDDDGGGDVGIRLSDALARTYLWLAPTAAAQEAQWPGNATVGGGNPILIPADLRLRFETDVPGADLFYAYAGFYVPRP